MKDIHNLITPYYAASWRTIGTHLGLQKGLLDIIDYNHPHQAEECCNAVWEQWLDMDTAATWRKVMEAVEVVVSEVHKVTENLDNSVQDPIPVLVTNARTQLQDFYKQDRYKITEDDWPSYQPEHFTSVALIHHKEKCVTTREVIAIANVLRKGEVNVGRISGESQQESSHLHYSSSSVTTNIAEIFSKLTSSSRQEDNTHIEPKVILIEGSPGIGKTILSKEIAFQWAKNQLLSDKLLLFLIFLRDPYLQNVQTLEHFVCYAISSTQRTSIVTAVEQYLEETSGKHCMIVFDGYDEISDKVKCNSFISMIINRKALRLCSLVITSRPTTSAVLHGNADRRVEILGFTKEHRNRYLHQSLKNNTDEIKKIEEYFEANPFIDSLCYIPLNMTILICLLKTSSGHSTGLPKTQTEINKQFIFVTIARYLKRKHKQTLSVKLLQSLPMPYKVQLDNLAKLAFVFLGCDKIVFNDDDVANDCPDCVGKWDSLGLLKIVKYYNFLKDSTSSSYNFLHFSIQEFLAAYYIVSLGNNKQIELLKNKFWNSKYLNTGIMYCGLTSGNSFALKHYLSGHRFVIVSLLFGAKHIRRKVSEDKVKCLHLFQCFLEADNDKLVKKVGKFLLNDTIDLSGNALLQKDIHIFSFFLIRSANKKWKLLDLSSCYIGDQGFDIFARSFAECVKNKTTIEIVNISSNHLTSLSITGIINLTNGFNVEKVMLCNNNIDYKMFDDKLLTNSIAHNKVMKMVVEKIEGFESSIYVINCKFYIDKVIVSSNPEIKWNLYFWNASFQVCNLSTFTERHVNIPYLNVYEEQCLRSVNIAKALQQFNNVGQCHVEYVLQSNTSFFAYNSSITNIIQAINSDNIFEHDKAKHLSNYVQEAIDLYHCSIGDTGFKIVVSHLVIHSHIAYIDTLNISWCNLTKESVSAIFDLLKSCITRHLTISDNSIPNSLLHDAILSEICMESKLLNFKNQVPLIIFNDNERSVPGSEMEPAYSVTKYIVNCEIDDDTVETIRNVDDTFVYYELFLSNIKLVLNNVKQLSFLFKNPFLSINIFQANISDELLTEIVSTLHTSRKPHYSYVLTSNTRLSAYNTNQKLISEGFHSELVICTLELRDCKLGFSKFDLLQSALCNGTRELKTINLSGCNIGDEGCEIFCLCFSNKDVTLTTLDLSRNCLSSINVVTKLLQQCVIRKLILSQNKISHNDIYVSLSAQYSTNTIKNFVHKIPVLITVSLQQVNTEYDVSCIYLIRSSFDTQVLHNMLIDKRQLCNIYLVDDTMKKVNITVQSSGSKLHVHPMPENDLDKLQEIIACFKAQQSITIIDLSYTEIDDAQFSVLCNQLFNPTSILKYITQLNLTGNKLTSCFASVIESLQHCIIQQIIISDNSFQNQFKDTFLIEYFSNNKICNFKLGIPLMVVQNSLFTAGHSAMILMKNVCINRHIYEMFNTNLQGYRIINYTLYFSLSDIMTDDLNYLLSLQLPQNTKFVIYETDLSDAAAKQTVEFLTVNFARRIAFLVSSKTMLSAHHFSYKNHISTLLTANSSITTLQLTDCILLPEQVTIMFSQSSNHFRYINLSKCQIGDDGFKAFVGTFPPKSYTHCLITLDVSMNNLTSSSINIIMMLLCHCIVKHLIISGNDINNFKFNTALSKQYWTSKNILNFVYTIPLVVNGTVVGSDNVVCNAYVTAIDTTDNICYLNLDDSVKCYYVHHLEENGKTSVFSFKNKNFTFEINPLKGKNDSMIPMKLNNVRFIIRRKFQSNIDLSACDFGSESGSLFCKMMFNKQSSLQHVSTLNLSSNLLSSQSMSAFVDCLQYCCFDYLIVSEHFILEKLADLVLKRCHGGERFLNSILSKPLTLISHGIVAKDICVRHAITYFINYKGTNKLEDATDSLLKQNELHSHMLVLFNCSSSDQRLPHFHLLQLVSHKFTFINLVVHEVGLTDEMAFEIIKTLNPLRGRVEYILASNKSFVVYRAMENGVIHALANSLSLETLVIEQCLFSQRMFVHIAFILSTKMKNLKRITLRSCDLDDSIYQEFSKVFFHVRTAVHYLKMLDISHNDITSSCVNIIISSLKTCIIEKLVISDNDFNNELVSSVFATGNSGGSDLCNFIVGIPMVIINNLKGDNSSTTAFVINCTIDKRCVNLLTDLLDYQASSCNLFLLNNCIQRKYLRCALSSLQLLMKKSVHLILFGIDLADEVATTIDEFLTKALSANTEYFIVSETKLSTNLLKTQSTTCSQLFNIVGCSVNEEMFGMYCKSIFRKVSHITELDISAYYLTSGCVDILIKCLETCSIEELTLMNSNNTLEKFTNAMLDTYAKGKELQNFISGIPMTIFGHTKVKKHLEVWVSLFCVNFYVNNKFKERFADLLVNEKYAQLQCVFINFLNSNQRMIISTSDYLSVCLANINNKVCVYEVGLQDETVTDILEQLIAVQEQVQYVLFSPKMFLAYRVSANLIIKALADVLHLPVISVPAFTISADETTNGTESVLSQKLRFSRRISLSQCDVDDNKYKQISSVLFSDKDISYLKELDISCSNITSSCISTITESLKSCIIEKLITANSINIEINNYLFTSAYYGKCNIHNFIKGIPFIVIDRVYYSFGCTVVKSTEMHGWWRQTILSNSRYTYCITPADDYSVQLDIITVFLVNSEVSNCALKKITDVSDYGVYSYSLFLFGNNIITNDLSYILSVFDKFVSMVMELKIFGTSLLDNIAVKIYNYLELISKPVIEYCLISETKLLSNMPNSLPISKWLASNPVTQIPGYNIGEQIFSIFCKSLSTYPFVIKEIDISSYQLTSKSIQSLVESLQYCCVEKLAVFNYENKLQEITEAIFKAHHAGKTLHNSISAVPLAVIGHTKEDNHTEAWVNMYFVDFKANDKFELMLCDFHANMNYSQLHCFFLNFFSNNQRVITVQNKTLFSLLFKYCTNIYMYETGLEDEVANEIVRQLETVDAPVKYVLASKTMLLAFRIEYLSVVDAVAETKFISTIKLKSIKFFHVGLNYTWSILSSKFKYLRNLSISLSHTANCKHLSNKSLISNEFAVQYLKVLDICQTDTLLSADVIIKSLQSCIIERFVVPNYDINCDLGNSIFLMAYYKENNILNFTMGIPLIIINSIQGHNESSTTVSYLKAFLINTKVDERTINLITDVSQYNISDCNLFVRNNTLLCNFNSVLSVFEHLMQKITCLTLFGTDLTDKMALKIMHHLTTAAEANNNYFLASETKVLTNVTNIQTISGTIVHDDDAVTLTVLNELTGMFCKSLSCSENSLKYFKSLDLSSHELSSTYAKLFVDSLQFCCVEKLIVLNCNKIMESIKDSMLYAYFEGKRMCNTISRIPLTVVGKGGIYHLGVSIHVYLVEILVTEEVVENIILGEWYDHLQYIFLNSMQNTCILPNKILSHACIMPFNYLIIYELGLQDERTLTIAEQLKRVNEQVQYVLVSKTILLACKANMRSIVKALISNPLIAMVKLTNCILSTVEFGSIFTANLKYFKSFSLSQCTIGDTTDKDIFRCDSIINTGAVIPYLKQLDLSKSTLELSCVSTLITALQSCIIGRIILSDNNIYEKLIYDIFLQTYCKKVCIVNFVMGIPLIIINSIQRKKSFIHYFTIFLINTVLNDIIKQITDLSGYNVYEYNLILLKNNVLANLNNVLPLFKYLLSRMANFTLFGNNLMKETAMKIAEYLNNVSGVNVEFSLLCKSTSLTKITSFEPIMQTLVNSKPHNFRYSILLLPLTLVSCVELLDISACAISNEDFLTLQEFLIQFHITIEILNVSYNKVSPIVLSKAIMDFHIQKLYLCGEFFPAQGTMRVLLPNLFNITNNLEIKFSKSTSFILCHMQSNIIDILNAASSSHKFFHLFLINCRTGKQNEFLDVIIPTLGKMPQEILSSVHMYNNSLKYQDIVEVVDKFTQVNLLIEENDFKFQSTRSDSEFSNIDNIVYFTSEHCGSVQMHWTPPKTSEIKFVSFHFKDLTMINCEAMIIQKLLRDECLYRVKVVNFHVINEVAKEIGTIIGNSHNLEHLELVNLSISDKSVISIFHILRKLNSLRYFTLRSINISSDRSAHDLVHVIANSERLEHLEISQCNLRESVIVEIATAFKDTKSLKQLNLSNNVITNTAASKLASVLNTSNSLKHLDLSSTELQEAGIIHIMQGLHSTSLEYFSLNNCNITSSAATEIASCIQVHFTSLTNLELSNCKLEETSLICITKALTHISSLCKLNLNFNVITKPAAVSLANVIANNSAITHLKLTLSHTSLIEVVSSCKTLSSLKCIDWNFRLFNFSYLAAAKFCLKDIIFKIKIIDNELDADDPYASVEKDIKEITHLTFTNCSCAEVFNCLESLLSLQYLDVNSSVMSYDVIANTIKKNTSLSHINISSCRWQKSFSRFEGELHDNLLCKADNVENPYLDNVENPYLDNSCNGVHKNFTFVELYDEYNPLKVDTTGEDIYIAVDSNNSFSHEVKYTEELYDPVVCYYNGGDDKFYEIVESLSSLQQLEYLNISGNKISDRIADVITATIHNNKRLQHLDLSNCKMQITGHLTICTALKCLNNLSYLDLSNNYFRLKTNDITSKAISSLHNVENANENLNYLLLSNFDKSGQLLEKLFQPCKALKYLDISCNAVTDDTANRLSSIIAEHALLQFLNMNGCIFSKYGKKCVTKSISSIAHLKCNVREPVSCSGISAAVFSNFKLFIFQADDDKNFTSNVLPFDVAKPIYYVDFASQCLTKKVLHSISTAFPTANIKSVTFINCDFREYNTLLILQLIKHIKTLKYFILKSFRMSEEALDIITQMICNNRGIKYLDLSDSKLSGPQFFIIAKALSNLSALQHLDISQNEVIDEAVVEIASVIINNTSLKYLNLSGCVKSDVGIQLVCNALTNINSLTFPNASDNHTTTQATKNLATTLSCSDVLQNIHSEPLVEMMSSKTFNSRSFFSTYSIIEYFNLSDCNLSEFGLMVILGTLRSMKHIKYLNLSRNEKAVCTLASLMHKNQGLHCLASLKCSVPPDGSLPSRVAAVVSHFVLFIFLLDDQCIHSRCETLRYIKPMYYVDITCQVTAEVKDCLTSAFPTTHVLYLNFENYDLGKDNAFVIMQAVEHINVLQYLIINSSEIHEKALDNIVLIICNNTGIKHIDISDCELSGSEVAIIAKAISKLSALHVLELSHNELTNEAAVEVASIITNNLSLQYLNLNGCDIKDFGIQVISDALKQTKFLHSLNIGNNRITAEAVETVASALFSNTTLQNIHLSNCFTENSIFTTLSHVLKSMKTITHVDLEGIIINDAAADDMSFFLTNNAIQHLNISNCNTSDAGMHKLLSALEEVATLEKLFLQCNKLNSKHADKLYSIIKYNYALKHLNISNCGLSHFQVMSYITLIHTRPYSIQYLDLSLNTNSKTLTTNHHDNQLPLFEHMHSSLNHLNLCRCGLSETVMSDTLLMLSVCTTFEFLNLNSCTIPNSKSIECIIANNNNLKYLDLSNCKLQEEQIIVIAVSLRTGQSIEQLLLSCNVITDATAEEISYTIYSVPSLKQLSLSHCELEEIGLLYIANYLRLISSLQTLDLGYNIISDKAAADIASALSNNTSLEYLDMSYCTWPNNGLTIIQESLDLEKFTMLKEADFTTL